MIGKFEIKSKVLTYANPAQNATKSTPFILVAPTERCRQEACPAQHNPEMTNTNP